MKNKICVYTCITGDYDEVKEFPKLKERNIDYYLFTNNKKIVSDFWQVVYIENQDLDNIRLARKIKVLGHPVLEKYDITVWLDGASYPRKKISEFIDKYCDLKKYSLIGFKHRERDCIYEEALECVKVRKDKKEIIEKQMKRYHSFNYPEHNGLIESTVMVRKNHDQVLMDTMKLWFDEIYHFSCRDQLSFNYVAFQTHLSYNLLDLNVFDNDYFGWEKHNQKKILGQYSVYFGSVVDFDYDSLLLGNYDVLNDKYIANFKCLKDVSEFKIEFANFRGILFSDLEVQAKNIKEQNLVNYSQYFEYQIFDHGIPTLFVYGDFKKGENIKISIKMELISEEFYFDLLKRMNVALINCSSRNENSCSVKILLKKVWKKLKLR